MSQINTTDYFMLSNGQVIKIIWHKPEQKSVKYFNLSKGKTSEVFKSYPYKKKMRRIVKNLGSNYEVVRLLYLGKEQGGVHV